MADQIPEYEQYAPQTGGRLFSNAMFGFNKEEVLEYLEELADENYQRQEAADIQIQELTKRIRNFETMAANQVAAPDQSGEVAELQARLEQLSHELDIARTATQQAEDELQQFREDLYNTRQENAWLREEFQKSDNEMANLRRQLEELSDGNWGEVQQAQQEAEEEIAELRRQLDEALAAAEQWDVEPDEEHGHHSAAHQTATAILAEANAEAERVRAEAYTERDRIRRQLQAGAGNLVGSVSNLREDVAGLEGDVGETLENMQMALADVMAVLNRTEQNLHTLGIQIDRYPASAPPVPQHQLVYFQPAPLPPEPDPTQSQAAPKAPPHPAQSAAPPNNYNAGGFRRVWPDSPPRGSNLRPFRPSYSTSQAVAPQLAEAAYPPQQDIAPDERLRNLSESLVETLIQMMT